MNKQDKIIIYFYIFLSISFIGVTLYMDNSFGLLKQIDVIPKQITEIKIEKKTDVSKNKIFEVMANVEDYPIVLPKNIVSVKILEQEDDFILAEEELIEQGITTKLTVKHILIPYEKHVIEIMDGDAQGTKIIQTFKEENSSTILSTEVELHLKGLLAPFGFLPKSNLQHAMDTIISSFIDYAKTYDSSTKKIIDDLYREILFRPVDKEGLMYYSSLLEKGLITKNELINILLNSDERKSLLSTHNLKTLDELDYKSKKIVNDLYLELLHRQADKDGLIYYSSLLENGQMSEEEIWISLFNSEEGTNVRIDTNSKRTVEDLYQEIFSRHATIDELEYYSLMLRSNNMTQQDIRDELLLNKIFEN